MVRSEEDQSGEGTEEESLLLLSVFLPTERVISAR